jgi:DDE superfamily endonuclease
MVEKKVVGRPFKKGPVGQSEWQIEGRAYDLAAREGPAFRAYVEQFLAPALGPGDVVVLDNLAAHRVEGVRRAIAAAGASILYLPPYSPDLNPIEQLFAKLKAPAQGRGTHQGRALAGHRPPPRCLPTRRMRQLPQPLRLCI